MSQIFFLEFDNLVPVDSLINLVKGLNYIKNVEGPYQAYLATTPNDYYYTNGNEWEFSKINAPGAWGITQGSSSIRISMNDQFGTLGTIHNDLSSKVDYRYDPSASGDHGAITSGVAGAITNNTTGIASLGWNTHLMFDRIGNTNDVTAAVSRGADVINFSWIGGYYSPMQTAIHNALLQGVICVAACGNDTTTQPIPSVVYPAAYNFGSDGQVIAVSGTVLDNNNNESVPAWNYSPGTDPINDPTNSFTDITAPGGPLVTLSGADTYSYYARIWGTSLSAPMVSALVSLMLSINNSLTPQQVYSIITSTADKILVTYTNGWNRQFGYGRINAYSALKYTLEYYGGTVSQNITIPSGETWTFQPGVTINFTNGAQLIVNGTLTANGNSASTPILFNFTSPNSTLNNGIRFNSSSSGTINYCQIRNADRGIYENSVNVNITNSAFSGCNSGIYLYSSNPTIQNNNSHNNNIYGIYLDSSSPYLFNNYSQNNGYGVYCVNSSNPRFGNGSTQGNNNIKDNTLGVFCWNNSYPLIGISYPPIFGGYNNLTNSSYNVYNNSPGTVYAMYNWWGTTVPANFKIAGTGYTSYANYLTSALNIAQPPLSKSVANNLLASDGSDIPLLDQLVKVNELIAENNLEQARNICINLITNYPDYSVSYNALNLLKDTYAANEISSTKNIYTTLFNSKVKKDLYGMAGLILSDIDKENKLSRIEDVINNYKGESIVELALFDKFVFYYFEKQDKDNALVVSKELDTLFPLSQGAIEAHRILGDMEYYKINANNGEVQQKTTSQSTSEYELIGNYPNPFNPTTKINYQLPKNGFVTLKVYDMLGREVASLVNENEQAGNYSVAFDAGKLSSGIYIYTIHANNFIQSKKMILMK
jgi:parallel beta-helix repeat protein